MPKLDPVAVFFALGSDVRWPLLKLIANGEPYSVSEIAAALKRDMDGVGRHLRVLEAAGMVTHGYGAEDRRRVVYVIPEVFRQTPGHFDFGCCVVALG